MRFSENRALAALVLVAVIVGSIVLGGGGGLLRQRNGVLAGYYGQMSIDSDLQNRAEAAYNLANAALNYPSVAPALAEAVLSARQSLLDAQSIPAQFAANAQLSEAIDRLNLALESAEIDEEGRLFLAKQRAEIDAMARTIGLSDYNGRAQSFNDGLRRFPARLIGALRGVEPLELFETEG